MFDLHEALQYLIRSEGSDLHLKVPARPLVRIHGRLEPVPDAEVLEPADTEAVLHALLRSERIAEFEAENEIDLAYAVEGLARFRVNVFRQRGSIAIVMRAIPYPIQLVDELGLPR